MSYPLHQRLLDNFLVWLVSQHPSLPPLPMDPTPTATESFQDWFTRQAFRHFKADELWWYFHKVRNGVRNSVPPGALWINIVPALRILDDLRDHFDKPVTINSTFRALPYNRAIGSPDGSQHPKFQAIDFTVKDTSPREVFAVLDRWRKAGRITGGLGLYRSFVHLDTRGHNATWGE